MAKSAFEKIKAGLEEAKSYLDGARDKRVFRVHRPERKERSAYATSDNFGMLASTDWLRPLAFAA